MPKKEVRPDTYAWFFAAKIYIAVALVFVVAIGVDAYHAVQAIGNMYGS